MTTELRPLPVKSVDEVLAEHPELEVSDQPKSGRGGKMNAKVFSEDQHGIPVHWEVEGADVPALTGNVSELLEWLDMNLFAAHVGFGQGHRNGPVAPQEAQQPPQDGNPAPTCPNGHTDWYDNRSSKRGNQPDYRCKTCKYGGWIKDDGEINWIQPRG